MNGPVLVRWLIDMLLALWFFYPVYRQGHTCSPVRTLIATCCLLITLPIYIFDAAISWSLLRLICRAGTYTLYLRLITRQNWLRCIYFGLVGWISFNICSNILLTPALRGAYFVGSFSEITWQTILLYVVRLAMLTVISRCVFFSGNQRADRGRIIFALLLCATQIYIKDTLNTITIEKIGHLTELSSYLILLEILLCAALIFFERYLFAQQIQEQEHIQNIRTQSAYENVVTRQKSEENVRRIHHDMKNHLLALQGLIGENQRALQYIHGLMEELGTYEQCVKTGNPLLDNLISEKMSLASKRGIVLTVSIDIRPCSYINDIDICTIFGNIIDNAIEAAEKVADPQKKSILLKSQTAANQIVITCSNYFVGDIHWDSELPKTTKSDRTYHGIGLLSVRSAVKKYGGILSLRTVSEQRIQVTILLPAA